MTDGGKAVNCAGVLVGGEGKRLGAQKPFVLLKEKPLIDWVLDALRKVFERIILVGKPAPELGKRAELVEDIFPGAGPISGIYTALSYLKEPVFICACDMPFLNPALIHYQISLLDDFDAVVPCPKGLFEPLHTIYTPACTKPLEDLIKKGKRRPAEIFNQLNVRILKDEEISRYDPKGLSFFNINTREELIKAEDIINNKYLN